MRTNITAAMIIVALYSAVSPSRAEEPDAISGNFFLPICKEAFSPNRRNDPLDEYNYGNCVGILDALIVLGPDLGASRRFCPPREATSYEAAQKVIAYLETRPRALNQNFIQLARDALAQAWPCK